MRGKLKALSLCQKKWINFWWTVLEEVKILAETFQIIFSPGLPWGEWKLNCGSFWFFFKTLSQIDWYGFWLENKLENQLEQAMVLQDHTRPYMRPYRTVPTYGTIPGHRGSYKTNRTIWKLTRSYGTIRDLIGSYGTIRDHTGSYRTIRNHKIP